MAASDPEPLVRFYDLSGPKPWSPSCWCTRFALNYIGIPYSTVQVGYPNIRPTCEKLFADMTNMEATVPIIEILGPRYEVLNDSTCIAQLLCRRFPLEAGYKKLEGVDTIEQYEQERGMLGRGIIHYIMYDTYENALDPDDGSKAFYKTTREAMTKCDLKAVMTERGGGEAAVLQEIRDAWIPLRERMGRTDVDAEPTYKDFSDAAIMKWVEAASPSKYQVLLTLYGDDTFTKLMRIVAQYSS